MYTGYDDNEVPDYGRNEGQIEQSHRLADFFMGVKTFDSAKTMENPIRIFFCTPPVNVER